MDRSGALDRTVARGGTRGSRLRPAARVDRHRRAAVLRGRSCAAGRAARELAPDPPSHRQRPLRHGGPRSKAVRRPARGAAARGRERAGCRGGRNCGGAAARGLLQDALRSLAGGRRRTGCHDDPRESARGRADPGPCPHQPHRPRREHRRRHAAAAPGGGGPPPRARPAGADCPDRHRQGGYLADVSPVGHARGGDRLRADREDQEDGARHPGPAARVLRRRARSADAEVRAPLLGGVAAGHGGHGAARHRVRRCGDGCRGGAGVAPRAGGVARRVRHGAHRVRCGRGPRGRCAHARDHASEPCRGVAPVPAGAVGSHHRGGRQGLRAGRGRRALADLRPRGHRPRLAPATPRQPSRGHGAAGGDQRRPGARHRPEHLLVHATAGRPAHEACPPAIPAEALHRALPRRQLSR